MEIIRYPAPILREPCQLVEEFTPEIAELAGQMILTMYKNEARGLSAPQIGRPINLFVCVMGQDRPMIFINPEIVEKSEKTVKSLEGCLSIPGVVANLTCRYEEVRIKAFSTIGDEFSLLFSSYDAITFQHEYDHLFGTILFDRMKSSQRIIKHARYMKRIKKEEKLNENLRKRR